MSYLKVVLATPQVARLGYLKDIACLVLSMLASIIATPMYWVANLAWLAYGLID